MSGMKSIGPMAHWASAAAIAVTPMKTRKRAAPKRRATGGPNAMSHIVLSRTCVQEPCRNA